MKLARPARLAAAIIVLATIALIAVSLWSYGLKVQSALQVSQIIPVLISGLFLGRRAVWLSFAGIVISLFIGLGTDLAEGMAWKDVLPYLLQPALGCLLVATILDRLISKSEDADRRSRELDILCEELELEMQEKEAKQLQLIHSKKMEAMAELAGSVAHDFSNLLSVILGHANDPLAEDSFAQARRSLQGIDHAARRGHKLTRRLLALSRESGAASTFDAGTALEELSPLLHALFTDQVTVNLSLPTERLMVRMNKDEFDLAILNIAANARDALQDKGRFTIAVALHMSSVRIVLEDNGSGMDEATLSLIFDPFFTTKAEGLGTGIGLATVFQSTSDAGGSVSAKSKLDSGTQIEILLPRVCYS
jgi:signal transduction histidine kinase